jgi:hypothetical protein
LTGVCAFYPRFVAGNKMLRFRNIMRYCYLNFLSAA